MKKFLSLVLALVMTMSLVTVSAGAKDFNDSDKISDIAYEEAVNVMSEMGIIDGYADGNFQPQGTLTRGAAAKIIACMMLGKTTAESLGTQAAPFKDVPVGSTFAGYIAYCSESGIIDGYSDGTFRPGNTLTGFAFLKMLLTALGYDSAIEGYANNANWTVNVAGRAKQVGLLDDNDNFVGTRAATREEACLYAVNALQATLVEYSDKGQSITINGATISTGASNAVYVTSNVYDQATSINNSTDNVKNGWTVEFAEKYQPDLALKDTTDAFGRPAHTWTWQKVEIGTYVDYDKMIAEYTTKVTGEDLYDLLGASAIDDCELFVYVDGETDEDILDGAYFDAKDLTKKNDEKVGETGDGVLTQVFKDVKNSEITVAIINTYLAQAAEDYDEKNDDVDLVVYSVENVGSARNPIYMKAAEDSDMSVSGEDFDIEAVKEDDLFLVNIADGEIQTMAAPEILSESTISNFKKDSYVTTGGTQYDYADTARYDVEVLNHYDDSNLKEVTYNVILDAYGYLIGIELNEDPDQYVFLTGIDLKNSNLSVKNADANVIFMDGKMDTVTVNVTKSDLDGIFAAAEDANGDVVYSQLNAWCTYSVNDSGVYTLKEVALAGAAVPDTKVAQYAQDVGAAGKDINEKNVSLKSSTGTTYVYGNDDTVYLNVELDEIQDANDNYVRIVDDVESVTTGVKNVNISVDDAENVDNENGDPDDAYVAPEAEIYTLYKDNGYIIATVTIGENEGTSSNYVYVTSKTGEDGVDQEAYADGKWTWIREVYADGELKNLTEVGTSKYDLEYLDTMVQGEWYEVKYDADGNVRKAEPVNFAIAADKFITRVVDVEDAVNDFDTVLLADTTTVSKLTFKNGTLYTNTQATEGFSVSTSAKILLVLADKTGTKEFDDVEVYSGYTGLTKALRDMNSQGAFTAGSVEISAILERGSAVSIVINDTNAPQTGIVDPGVPEGEYAPVSWGDTQGRGSKAFELRYYGNKQLTESEIKAGIAAIVGSPVDSINYLMGTVRMENGDVYPVDFDQIKVVAIWVDDTIAGYKDAGAGTADAVISGLPANTAYITGRTSTEAAKLSSSAAGVLTVEDDLNADLKLNTAYAVVVGSPALAERYLADEDGAYTIQSTQKYVIAGETIKLKVLAAGNYIITVGDEATQYTDVEANELIPVKVTANVKIEEMEATYQTEDQIQADVTTALETVKGNEGTATGIDSITVDGNEISIVLDHGIDLTNSESVKDTGLIDAAGDLIAKGNTISVSIGGVSVEITATNGASVKGILLNALADALESADSATINVTVKNTASGAVVTGTVLVSQADA